MSDHHNLLKDKVVLITGGARGIGKGIAELFAREHASVMILDIVRAEGEKVARSLCRAGLHCHFCYADLRKESDIKSMVDYTVSSFGKLDILINNAKPILQKCDYAQSLEEWDLAMDLILKAPALAVKYAIPEMIKSGGGCILNISSTNAVTISHQPVTYHVAKAGLVQLTRYVAYEFGKKGIRANALCPALVDLYDKDRRSLTSDPVNKKLTELVVPLGNAATAEEIAKAALFLCREDSGYITGQVVIIDGGMTLGDQFGVARKAYQNYINTDK